MRRVCLFYSSLNFSLSLFLSRFIYFSSFFLSAYRYSNNKAEKWEYYTKESMKRKVEWEFMWRKRMKSSIQDISLISFLSSAQFLNIPKCLLCFLFYFRFTFLSLPLGYSHYFFIVAKKKTHKLLFLIF